jgi:hypothetical protein
MNPSDKKMFSVPLILYIADQKTRERLASEPGDFGDGVDVEGHDEVFRFFPKSPFGILGGLVQ